MADNIALSSSAITAFEQCPWSFFKMREHKEVSKSTPAMELGNIVHKVLENYYDDANEKSLLELYEESWIAHSITNQALYKSGKDMLENYYYKYGEPVKGQTIAREYRFAIEFAPGYTIRGVFDRVDMLNDKGDYEIIDYKTSNTPKTQDEADTDLQISIYDLMFRKLVDEGVFGDIPKPRNVRLSLEFLKYNRVTSSRSDIDREELEEYLLVVAKQINSCENPPKRLNSFCAWCMLKDSCEVYSLATSEITESDTSIELMDDDELMAELKRLNYLTPILDDRKQRIKSILMAKLDMLGLETITTDNHAISMQYKTHRVYDIKKLRNLLEPIGIFDDVVRVNLSRLDRVANDKNISDLVREALIGEDRKPWLKVRKV